ncbi:MAG: hypothetical protein JEZ03_13920 [Bacteroidales bacterium]|nr:hypothetical protein [Bacteroidales bacterium]
MPRQFLRQAFAVYQYLNNGTAPHLAKHLLRYSISAGCAGFFNSTRIHWSEYTDDMVFSNYTLFSGFGSH